MSSDGDYPRDGPVARVRHTSGLRAVKVLFFYDRKPELRSSTVVYTVLDLILNNRPEH